MLSGRTGTLWVLCLAFFLCGLGGVFCCGLADEADLREIRDCLKNFMSQGGTGGSVLSVIWQCGCSLLLVLVLGTTPLGSLGIPLVLGESGFLLGFSMSCFYRSCGGMGFLLGLIVLGLTALLRIPMLFLAGSRGAGLCREPPDKRTQEMNQMIGVHLLEYLMLLGGCVLIEYAGVPFFLEKLSGVIVL